MKNEIKIFLKQNGFLPINLKNNKWKHSVVFHPKNIPNEKEIKAFDNIVQNLKKSGIYAYKNEYKKKEELLYVGRSNNISKRVKSHFNESYKPIPPNTKAEFWYKFFSKNAGKLVLYWQFIEQDKLCVAVEKMIEAVLTSKFSDEYELYKKQKQKRSMISKES